MPGVSSLALITLSVTRLLLDTHLLGFGLPRTSHALGFLLQIARRLGPVRVRLAGSTRGCGMDRSDASKEIGRENRPEGK